MQELTHWLELLQSSIQVYTRRKPKGASMSTSLSDRPFLGRSHRCPHWVTIASAKAEVKARVVTERKEGWAFAKPIITK